MDTAHPDRRRPKQSKLQPVRSAAIRRPGTGVYALPRYSFTPVLQSGAALVSEPERDTRGCAGTGIGEDGIADEVLGFLFGLAVVFGRRRVVNGQHG